MLTILFSIVLSLSLTQQIVSVPVPTTTTTTETTTTTTNITPEQNNSITNDEVTMNCLMEAIMAMSGGDKSVSEFCKNFLIMQQSDGKDNSVKTGKEVTAPPATADPDLQNELNDLTSQLRGINADYDVNNDDNVLGLKRSANGELNENNNNVINMETGKKNNEDILDNTDQSNTDDDIMNGDSINTPFITSLNEEDGEFLVIPLDYLKNEILNEESLIDSIPEENQEDEKDNGDSDVTKEAFEKDNDELIGDSMMSDNNNYDAINNNNDAQAVWNDENTPTEDAMTEKEMAIMYRLELDLSRLGEDLKILNIRPSSLKE